MTEPKIDKRTKEGKAMASSAPRTYEQDVEAGFAVAKAGGVLPTDATEGFRQGFDSGRLPPAPPPARIIVESANAWDDEGPQSGAPVDAAPVAQVPAVFRAAKPVIPEAQNSSLMEIRAVNIIRQAHERADADNKAAHALLANPGSPAARAAFEARYKDSTDIPPPPARTPYGDKDEAWLRWEAAFKPEEFISKNARCAAPLVRQLLAEIEARKAD